MSYSSLIKNSKEKVYNHAIAIKILDLLDKLRMDDNGKSKRRWIWELIQNAKDVRYPGKFVTIEINLNEDIFEEYLIFKHNGKPFSIDNLTFLIEQVSTKERKSNVDTKPTNTGKFGTGFLTTHLLSEKVTIEGYIKEPELPFKKFNLELNRSGKDIDEIIESIKTSLEVLSTIEESDESLNFNENDLNTVFSYPLDDEGIKVAKIGLKDLDNTLPYTMVFVPEIRYVKIASENVTFTALDEVLEINNDIRVHTIKRDSPSLSTELYIAELSSAKTSIAIPVSFDKKGNIIITRLPRELPRLFCDFPLIGSEDFYVPVIINSPYFNPNEPRSGVFLTDRSNEKVNENKALIEEAIGLYHILLKHASNNLWQNMFLMANVSNPAEKDWLSLDWYEKNVLNPIHDYLSTALIVDTEENGRQAIVNSDNKPRIWFPYSSNKDVRDKIWKLGKQWIPSIIPISKNIHDWYPFLWHQCGKLSIKVIANSIQSFKTINTLKENLINKPNPIKWLNEFFDLVNYQGKFIDEIVNDKYSLLPNQKGEFKKMSELFWDNNIDEELKEILLILGEDIKEKLREKLIITNNNYDDKAVSQIKHVPRKPDDIVTKINKLILKADDKIALKASLNLISLFPKERKDESRQLLFELSKQLFQSTNEKRIIYYNDSSIWIEADQIVINAIVKAIAVCINLKSFTERYKFNSAPEAIVWLDSFINFLTKSNKDQYLNIHETPILPNQNGEFKIKDILFLDDGSIDEKLKDIGEKLDYPVQSDLLVKTIYLELPNNRIISQQIVAEKISNLILPKFSELPRTEKTKDIFRSLYLWFKENKEIADLIFHELYSSRHKLYDDDEVAENMQNAEDLKQLLDEFDITNIKELREIIRNAENIKSNNKDVDEDLQPITKETLVSLGIGSFEELEIALRDIDLAKVFLHNSVPTVEMFLYAQNLIERSKKNILAYLNSLPEYDCSEVEEIAPTILAGIKHNNVLINVVTRPSDNGEVIIYYSSEKDILEIHESELWIDNGIYDPSLLTLGKILKVTGITKIPIS